MSEDTESNLIVHCKGYRVEILSRNEIRIRGGNKPPTKTIANEIVEYLIWEDFLTKGKIHIGISKEK